MDVKGIEAKEMGNPEEHVQYDFWCQCPTCKTLMVELAECFACVGCGTMIDKETKEIVRG